tara:strand:- start:539 stop:1366 length:828 start_codon:yes stop_codon:yes gene_type:complete
LEKETLKNNRWVDVPMTPDVWHLLKEQRISDTYYARGNGDATQDLEWVEATHRNWVHDIIDLSEFNYCYVTNGTTDAIHQWLLTEDREYQYISGEYEYPQMIKKGTETTLRGYNENKVLYLSNPFAGDGNFKNVDVNCPVILDCTYISSTNIQKIHVPKNTEQVFFSFSKGFGMIGNRLGLVYTKKPHKTLHTLKGFENWNYASVKTMELIMSNYKVNDMFIEYRDKQLELCGEYSLIPSDCFFLAVSGDSYYKKRRRMKDNPAARLCLTPLTRW